MADTEIDSPHGSGWLDKSRHTVLQPVPDDRGSADGDDHAWRWLDRPAEDPPPPRERRTVRPTARLRWLGIAAGLAVVAAVATILAVFRSGATEPDTAVAHSAVLAAPPTTSATPAPACTGLSGEVVTDGAGDRRSLSGVVAAFEYAYYQLRDAAAALGLVAPEAGLVFDALAVGIASIPTGSTHCVAISPIAPTTAEVHLVERHPDGTRIDYLQLINVRPADQAGGDLVISNIQKRG
ncbi:MULTISPECIES: hypothetical protein [Nocardia]|uniref:hypothetical protein n=1 Tax=Nocardia TaxID=1817 RepID=UPI00031CD89B|nr:MULTISPECIES: hypothetical protein [Nocardia]